MKFTGQDSRCAVRLKASIRKYRKYLSKTQDIISRMAHSLTILARQFYLLETKKPKNVDKTYCNVICQLGVILGRSVPVHSGWFNNSAPVNSERILTIKIDLDVRCGEEVPFQRHFPPLFSHENSTLNTPFDLIIAMARAQFWNTL